MIRLRIETPQRECMLDVTRDLQDLVRRTGLAEGICHVFVPHTTAAVTINENADPDVCTDMLAHLRRLVPDDPGFRHAEGNSDAHIKATLVGASVTVPVEAGSLQLGRWQGVYFCEFDGPRIRELGVTMLGG